MNVIRRAYPAKEHSRLSGWPSASGNHIKKKRSPVQCQQQPICPWTLVRVLPKCPSACLYSFRVRVIFEFFKKQHSLSTRRKKNLQNVNIISVSFSQCVPVKERLRRNCFQISASEERSRLAMLLFPLLQLFSISECF